MFDKPEPVSAFAMYSQVSAQNAPAKINKKKKINKNKRGDKKQQITPQKQGNKPKLINGHSAKGKEKNINKKITFKKQENKEKLINGNSGKGKEKNVNKNKVKLIVKQFKEVKFDDNIQEINKKPQKKVSIVTTTNATNDNKITTITSNKAQNEVKEKQKDDFVFKKPNIEQYKRLTKHLKIKDKKQKHKIKKSKDKIMYPRRQKSSSGYFYVDNHNSMKKGEHMFKWVIDPINVNQFFKENWEKLPIIVQRNCPTYYTHLLSCADIDEALRKKQIYFTKNIDITSYTPETGVRETHNPPGRATAPLVWDFYSNGCSIRILNPQTFFPKVHALNASLQEYFGCFVGANVYLTPADSQGFAPHFDDIEAFVVQIEGEKMWKLYAPRSPSEVLPRFSSGNFTEKDLGPPIQEVLLKAGDMMYFPRGFIHQGVALGNKHSLHITLSMYQKNSWADLLETLMPAALKSAIEENSSYREGLPMHFLSHLGLVHSDKSSEIRTQFMNKLQNLIKGLVDFAPVDAAVDQIGKKFIHDSLPPALRSDEKETTVFEDGERIVNGVVRNQAEICLASRIKLLRYNCIRMLQEEDSIRIYYSISNSKEYHEEEPQFLEIDEDLAPAVEALITAYPEYITVESLPIEDDIAKVQIASDLWENGILKTEHPLSYED